MPNLLLPAPTQQPVELWIENAKRLCFSTSFLSIFTPDAALISYAVPYVRTYIAGVVLFGIQIACQQTFVALGNAKCSLFLACLRKLILLIPLVYLLPNFFTDQVFAVFLAEPVADFIAVCSTAALFLVVFRKTMGQLEAPAKV